ncbi:MAG: hypothetical protein DME50_10945 [Verrucomicrobia bacterium]|nr:MAG: hypothetical protein DME50_10945 [Verrucomicrobiota bacterium]
MNGEQGNTWMQLQIRPVEAKLLALALDPAARGNEIVTAAEKLIRSLRERGISATELFRGSQLKPKPAAIDPALERAYATVMPFGKHKGKRLRDIPVSYLVWAESNCTNASAGLLRAITKVLGE